MLLDEGSMLSAHHSVNAGRKQLLHLYRLRDDSLLKRVLDHLLRYLPVRSDAVGERVATRDFHDSTMQIIDPRQVLNLATSEALGVMPLGLGEVLKMSGARSGY